MPGSFRVENNLANVIEPDGLTFGIVSRGCAVQQALEIEGIEFDSREFSWIGGKSPSTHVVFVHAETGIKTFEDLKAAPQTLRSTYSVGGNLGINPVVSILLKAMGGNLENISLGSQSSAVTAMAFERGELDLYVYEWTNLLNLQPHWLEKINIIAYIGPKFVDPRIENVPRLVDLAETPLHKEMVMLWHNQAEVGRPYAGPPGLPPERLQILQTAFEKAVTDPDYLAEAEKLQFRTAYTTGEELKKFELEMLNVPPETLKALKELLWTTWGWELK